MTETARAVADTLRYCYAVSRRLSLTDDSVDYSGGQLYDFFADFVFPPDTIATAEAAITLTVTPLGATTTPKVRRANREAADWLASLLYENPQRFRPLESHPVETRLARLFAPYVMLRAADCVAVVAADKDTRINACRDIARDLTAEVAADVYQRHFRSHDDPVYPFEGWVKVANWVIVLVLRAARTGRGQQADSAADLETARLRTRIAGITQMLDMWVVESPYGSRDPRILLEETTNDLMRGGLLDKEPANSALAVQPDELLLFFDLCIAPGLLGSLARTTLASMD